MRSTPVQTGELLGFQVPPQAVLARCSFPQTKQNWETRAKCPAHSMCSALIINLHFPSHRDRNKTPTSAPALSEPQGLSDHWLMGSSLPPDAVPVGPPSPQHSKLHTVCLLHRHLLSDWMFSHHRNHHDALLLSVHQFFTSACEGNRPGEPASSD